MSISIQKKKEVDKLKVLAVEYVHEGYSFRETAKKLGRSHQWVKLAMDELQSVDK
jgi:hypothetical protein